MLNGTTKLLASGLLVLSLVWLGLLLGVSFLATPAKFLAPSLSLAVALDVGRHTFRLFSMLEAGFAAAALLLALTAARQLRRLSMLAAALAVLVAIQVLWMLPALDARVELLLDGGRLVPSRLHTFYIAFDAAKCLLLMLVAHAALRLRLALGA